MKTIYFAIAMLITFDSMAQTQNSSYVFKIDNYVVSDRKLKKDISPYEDGLSQVLKLKPVWYYYNGKAGTKNNEQGIGLIAQDVEKVTPYLIKNSSYTDAAGVKTDYKSVNYDVLVFMLINGMKEQQRMIDELKMEVESLKQNASE